MSEPFNTDLYVGKTPEESDAIARLYARCCVSQEDAGFAVADSRQFLCPDCGKPGFNTGWGYISYICGAEWLSDGEPDTPCGAKS